MLRDGGSTHSLHALHKYFTILSHYVVAIAQRGDWEMWITCSNRRGSYAMHMNVVQLFKLGKQKL